MSDNRKEVIPLYYIGLTEEKLRVVMRCLSKYDLGEDHEIAEMIYCEIDEDFPEVMKGG